MATFSKIFDERNNIKQGNPSAQTAANQQLYQQRQTTNSQPTNTKHRMANPRTSSATQASNTASGSSQQKQTYTYTTNANNQPYVAQLNSLYDQIMNRKPFQYDLNGDLLYRQMADRYAQMGQMAMRDATGTAAGLTGGYGNSYANQVGNQAYQQYMTALNDNIPDLYNQALQAYLNEGDQLLQQYQLAAAHPEYLDAMSPKTYTVTQNAAATPAAAGSAATGAVAGAETAYMNQLAKWLYKDQAK